MSNTFLIILSLAIALSFNGSKLLFFFFSLLYGSKLLKGYVLWEYESQGKGVVESDSTELQKYFLVIRHSINKASLIYILYYNYKI